MTVNDLIKVHYLSCVEAYFGAWIGNRIPPAALYSESYLPWSIINRAFADDSVSYAAFPLIARLQDFAEEAGVTTHRKICGIPDCYGEDDLLLMSVTNGFFERQIPWRRDHYIAVTKLTNRKIAYLNEYPLGRGIMNRSEFYEKYGGDCLLFSFKKKESSLFGQRSVCQLEAICQKNQNSYTELSAVRLRDAIGILRVSRRRMVEWLRWFALRHEIPFAEKLCERALIQVKYADNCYFRLQRFILRGEIIRQSLLNEITERIGALEFVP